MPAHTESSTRTLILAGPTASGKTALALALAEHLPLEIISVDSALIYRGMDIGTAKPSLAEQAAVPHHLIDILAPLESYSAARFVSDTRRLMTQIRARGRIPLLVGGTMLYIKALIDGLDEIPAANPQVRAMLDERAAQEGWPALHEELCRVDPVVGQRLAPNDSQRIQRALEVFHSSGLPLSHFQRLSQGELPSRQAHAPADTVMVSLEPQDRHWLHERIGQRYQQMMAGGLIDEVQRLRERGDLNLQLPSMRCVGYRQVWEAMDEGLNLQDPAVRLAVAERGAAATRQLAKRQITWLRSMPWRLPLACDQSSLEDMRRACLQALWP
jgi:tRNA dimethylallyltransferase